MSQELLEYIKANFARGYSVDQIRQALLGAGYQDTDIDVALQEAQQDAPIQNMMQQPEQRKRPHLTHWLIIGIILIGIVIGVYFFWENPLGDDLVGSTDVEDDIGTVTDTTDTLTENRSVNATSKNCRLYANLLTLHLAQRDSQGLFASGYAGTGDEIVWTIDDEMVASLVPERGSFSTITATGEGTARITLTDTAVSDNCTYKVLLTVGETVNETNTNETNTNENAETI